MSEKKPKQATESEPEQGPAAGTSPARRASGRRKKRVRSVRLDTLPKR